MPAVTGVAAEVPATPTYPPASHHAVWNVKAEKGGHIRIGTACCVVVTARWEVRSRIREVSLHSRGLVTRLSESDRESSTRVLAANFGAVDSICVIIRATNSSNVRRARREIWVECAGVTTATPNSLIAGSKENTESFGSSRLELGVALEHVTLRTLFNFIIAVAH